MKKKGLVLLLCLAMVLLLGVNNTLANSAQGLFKDLSAWLGDVLGKPDTNPRALKLELVSTADDVLMPSHYPAEFDWSLVQAVTKTTYAENVAQEAAFVRICIAVKTDEVLKYTPPTGSGYVVAAIPQNGYTLYTLDYTAELPAGAKTPEITMKVALTKETDNDDLTRLGTDFVKLQSFAIQASAFEKLDEYGNKIPNDDITTPPMKPETALKNALGDMATFNPFE